MSACDRAVSGAPEWRFRPDDDVVERGRKFGRMGSKVAKALETTPVSVRIDFTD